MPKNSISLQTLLETHESPFMVIDSALTIVGVNKAWEHSFSVNREEYIGRTCCSNAPNCRHQELFNKLEPYEASIINEQNHQLNVRGVPLLDNDGQVFLGEMVKKISHEKTHSVEPKMVGSCTSFMSYQRKLMQAAQSQVPVFLTGETGTGKELAADFIHSHSERAEYELVIVDCTVLSEELFESELFGHEKGSFTGAGNAKKGLFEIADKGTLFLDEIGELPLSQQPKLLRALETGQFRRVGGTKALHSNVRLVCATHRNLARMVKDGLFREDLFYRLSVFPVQVPALRERMNDIPEITDYLLHLMGQREGKNYSIEKSALIKLLRHQWPGNIRELKNCLQLATSLSVDAHISEADINYMQQAESNIVYHPTHMSNSDLFQDRKNNPLEQMESNVIQDLIEKYQGNRKLIAAEMDISERTLYRKLKRFNLN